MIENPNRRAFLRCAGAAGSAALWGVGAGLASSASASPASAAPLKLLILGGTGFLGPQFVEAAIQRGHTVTLFNRGKTNPKLFPDLEKLQGDRNDKGSLKVFEGRKWDAVVDTSGYVPKQVRDVCAILAPNIGHYVFISTCSVYKDNSKPGIDETAEVAVTADPETQKVTETTYGPLKALCEKAAEDAMPGRVSNVRPGLIVGPGDPTDRFTYWPVRVAKGGKVLAPHASSEQIQLIDVRDLGEWLVRLCETRAAGVFNALGPSPDHPLTIGATLDACKRESKSDAEFVWVDEAFLEKHKVSAWMDLPAWAPNRGETAGFAAMRNDRAAKAGLTLRPIAETARATLDWFQTLPEDRRKRLKAGLTPEREAEVLKAWEKRG